MFLVSTLAILIFNNIKKEKELQEAFRLEQEQAEKEAQELKKQQEQQKQAEKEHQEKLTKWNTEWNALGDSQQYLALGSEYFYREGEANLNGLYSFHITEEFLGTLFTICDGWYNGATVEDLRLVLNSALASLPNNATAQETYDAFMSYTEMVNRDAVITGKGQNPYDILVKKEPTQNTQQSNNSGSGTSGGGSGTGGSNTSGGGGGSTTNANNGGSSTSSPKASKDYDGDGDIDDTDYFYEISGANPGPTGDPNDHQVDIGGGLMSGGNTP